MAETNEKITIVSPICMQSGPAAEFLFGTFPTLMRGHNAWAEMSNTQKCHNRQQHSSSQQHNNVYTESTTLTF